MAMTFRMECSLTLYAYAAVLGAYGLGPSLEIGFAFDTQTAPVLTGPADTDDEPCGA